MISIIPNPKPHAFNTPVISPKYFNNPHSSFSFKFPLQRRCSQIHASSSILPLLPFPIDQVLVPSEAKTLHLYEARYLALLEESFFKNKLFVHFVLDPIVFGGTSFAARYGCLVIIEKVERLEVGALVSVRGVGRVNILDFKQMRYELIADERVRRETFRKRKQGLFKKLYELKTLCDIEACAILYNGDGPEPEVWPSPQEASRVVQKFKSLPPSLQTNNMVNQEGFLMQNLLRLEKNLDKETKKVESLEKELILAECLNKDEMDVNNVGDLQEMIRLLERKIRMVDHKIANIEPSSSTMVADAKEAGNEPHHGKGKQPL